MAAYTSTQAGEWNDPNTWGGGGYPDTNGDTATITHTVTYSISADVELGQININSGGTLSFNPSANTYMEMATNTAIRIDDGGWLEIGTSAAPIHKDYTAKVGFNSTANIVGIDVYNTGSVSIYGDPDYFGRDKETFMANDGTNSYSITATDDMSSKWNVGDHIAIDKHEPYTNWNLSGLVTRITGFGAGNVIQTEHEVSSDFNEDGIIVNLTRNVEIFKVGYYNALGDSQWYRYEASGPLIYFRNHESQKWFSAAAVAGFYYITQAHMNYYTNTDGLFEWVVFKHCRYTVYNSYGPKIYNCVAYGVENGLVSTCRIVDVRDSITIGSYRHVYSTSYGNIENSYVSSCGYGLINGVYSANINNCQCYSSPYAYQSCHGCTVTNSYSALGYYESQFITNTKFINCHIGSDPNGKSKPNNYFVRHYMNSGYEFINCTITPSSGLPEMDANHPNTARGAMNWENYNQVEGDHRSFQNFGNSKSVNADGNDSRPTQRSGGSYRIQEVEVYSSCGIGNTLEGYTASNYPEGSTIFECFEHQIWMTAGVQKTIRYYIQTDYTNLTSDKIYLGIVPLYRDTSIVSDENITTRSNQSDWSQYVEVTTTPSQDGWIRLQLTIWGYESGKYIWVDPKPEIIF